jgi:valyl-tRNA synthetase
MELEYTQEEIQKSILAAYDSVNLINNLIKIDASSFSEKELKEHIDTIERNKKHIEIMLAKEWFANGLTKAQKSELKVIIA